MRKNITRSYVTWANMKQRCQPNYKQSKDYYSRGIRVCREWESYDAFLADMGERPEGMTLDRINNDGNYEVSNCRWADRKTQNNNSRHNTRYTIGEKTHTLTEWCEIYKIRKSTVVVRMRRNGWEFQKAVSTALQRDRSRNFNKGE